ncbi:hypothetical protein, partial [Pseudomonas helleri]|uniref:hypothetical protein n=1 Tax=Pseudomonas helleri TaxID=1608996 RepID=UPI0038251BED
ALMAVSLNCSVYLFMLKTQKVGWVSNFLGAVQSVGASLPRDLFKGQKIARQARSYSVIWV